jgi:hypothetical protein
MQERNYHTHIVTYRVTAVNCYQPVDNMLNCASIYRIVYRLYYRI